MLVISRDAFRVPIALGSNRICTCSDAPGVNVNVVRERRIKSPVFVPDIDMEKTFKSSPPGFVTVIRLSVNISSGHVSVRKERSLAAISGFLDDEPLKEIMTESIQGDIE